MVVRLLVVLAVVVAVASAAPAILDSDSDESSDGDGEMEMEELDDVQRQFVMVPGQACQYCGGTECESEVQQQPQQSQPYHSCTWQVGIPTREKLQTP